MPPAHPVAAVRGLVVVAGFALAGCLRSVPVATDGAVPERAPAEETEFVAAPADSCARAQRRAEQEPVFKVMREARPYRTNAPPAYPLRERHVRYQQVTVKFLVSPLGTVDTSKVTVVSTSGPRFTESVFAVLPAWRFHPAELVPGCRVWFQVTMPVVFNTPPMRTGY